jgi:hypothetical protein
MSMTVKKLIESLQTIENKLLEVEVYISTKDYSSVNEIDHIKRTNKKVLIFTKENKDVR